MASAREALERSLGELDELCRDQGLLADRLVQLAEVPLETLLGEIGRTEELLCRRHRGAVSACEQPGGAPDAPPVPLPERLRRDHARFDESVAELRWYFDRVAVDAHGGNRQALGQYWRLVVEAVARHSAEERETLARTSPTAVAEDGVIKSARSLPRSEASAWPSRTS